MEGILILLSFLLILQETSLMLRCRLRGPRTLRRWRSRGRAGMVEISDCEAQLGLPLEEHMLVKNN